MIEVGKKYRLKDSNLAKSFGEYKILDEINPNTVECEDENGQKWIFLKSFFIDPETPEDNIVFFTEKPRNAWKELEEDFGALGAGPVAAVGALAASGPSGCTFNGIPVAGQSMMAKKKKKKSKKNEDVWDDFDNSLQKLYDIKSTVTPEEMLELVDETFAPNAVYKTLIENNREKVRVSVYYTNPEDALLTHTIKLEFLDEADDVINEIVEEDLTIKDCLDTLKDIFKNHKAITEAYFTKARLMPETELFEMALDWLFQLRTDWSFGVGGYIEYLGTIKERNLLDEYVKYCKEQGYRKEQLHLDLLEPLNENFNEKYEEITALIAKQLDRLNFSYANTDEIIYRKEGEYKYLLKFDNEIGLLKFKISKDQDVILEKEWQLETEEDVDNAFLQIEKEYKSRGI